MKVRTAPGGFKVKSTVSKEPAAAIHGSGVYPGTGAWTSEPSSLYRNFYVFKGAKKLLSNTRAIPPESKPEKTV